MILILLSCFFGCFNLINAEKLSLPLIYTNKPIYYIKAHQLDKWSCGYNVLFNACNVEQHCGRINKGANFNHFSSICGTYLNSIYKESHKASTNNILDDLSQKLKLQDNCYLHLDSYNKIEPLLKGSVKIKYYGNPSQTEIDRLFKEAIIKRNQDRINEINKMLNNNKDKLYFVHFFCHVEDTSGPHVLLISLIQNKNGRSLYIFDNLNAVITQYSQTMQYIDYIYSTFKVYINSDRNFINFPNHWPSYI